MPPRRARRISRRSCPSTCTRCSRPATRRCGSWRCTAAASAGPAAPTDEWMPSLTSARAGLPASARSRSPTHRHRSATRPSRAIVGESRRERLRVQALVDGRRATSWSSARRFSPVARAPAVPDPDRAAADHRKPAPSRGSIVASFIPAAPRGFFRTIDVGKTGAVWVFHPDGVVLFREPSTTDPLGDDAADNPIFAAGEERRRVRTSASRRCAPAARRCISAFRTHRRRRRSSSPCRSTRTRC